MNKVSGLIAVGILTGVFLLPPAWADAAEAQYLTIYGVGYPPVRTPNKAQALLMARRAAVLDAFRQALKVHSNMAERHDVKDYYQSLSGFVKGMTIIGEEHQQDGGIRIMVRFI